MMQNIYWNKLPDTNKLKFDIEREFESIGNIKENGNKPTLYQFSLHVLCRIYYWLENSIENVNDNEPIPIPVPQPTDEKIQYSSLRAVAYFSWEKERHTFLIRRVYPISFDFLSYSHVPDGWGALGKMRAEIAKDNKSYTCIENVRNEVLILPYLREATRLDYCSVLVAPVKTEQDLLGAFVFYLRDENSLPTEDLSLKFDAISSAMAVAVQKHLEIITGGIDELPKLWRERKPRPGENSAMLELNISVDFRRTIEPNAVEIELILDSIATSVLSALNNDDIFTILDKSTSTENSTIFLSIGKETDAYNLKKQILSAAGIAVGEICSQNDDLFFQFSCK